MVIVHKDRDGPPPPPSAASSKPGAADFSRPIPAWDHLSRAAARLNYRARAARADTGHEAAPRDTELWLA